jgi:hypothetical protein
VSVFKLRNGRVRLIHSRPAHAQTPTVIAGPSRFRAVDTAFMDIDENVHGFVCETDRALTDDCHDAVIDRVVDGIARLRHPV